MDADELNLILAGSICQQSFSISWGSWSIVTTWWIQISLLHVQHNAQVDKWNIVEMWQNNRSYSPYWDVCLTEWKNTLNVTRWYFYGPYFMGHSRGATNGDTVAIITSFLLKDICWIIATYSLFRLKLYCAVECHLDTVCPCCVKSGTKHFEPLVLQTLQHCRLWNPNTAWVMLLKTQRLMCVRHITHIYCRIVQAFLKSCKAESQSQREHPAMRVAWC